MRRGPTVSVGRQGPGLVGTMARTAVIAGTATATVGATKAVMGGGAKKEAASQQAAQQAAAQQAATDQQIADLQAQQQVLAAQQAAAPAGPVPGSLEDQANQIRQLQVMKDQGLLTDEEFQAKKKQILGI